MTIKNTPSQQSALQAAQQALKAGDLARAAKLARQAIQEDPADHRPWLVLAFLADSAAQARTYLRRAEALKPGDPGVQQARHWVEVKFGAAVEKETAATATAAQAAEAGTAPAVEAVGEAAAGDGVKVPAEVPAQAGVEAVAVSPVRSAQTLQRPFIQPDLVWSAVGAVALAVLIWLDAGLPWLGVLRLPLGLLYVLFVPGYWLVTALFPRADSLSGLVRLALSISMSVAMIPVLALILDWLPWGIRLWPVVISEGAVILIFSLATWVRRLRLPARERFIPVVKPDVRGWWAVQDRVNRIVYVILLGLVLVALASAVAITLIPKPGEYFTEFYMVGPEGLMENYPYEPAVGEALSVTVGVTNLEGEAHTYRVEAWAVDPWEEERRQVVGEMAAFSLAADENFEYPLGWSMPWAGEDQQVEIYLYIDEGVEPYRQLRLWLDVLPAEE